MATVRQDKVFNGNKLDIVEAIDSNTAPAVTDDETKGYRPGSRWIRQSTGKVYVAITVAAGAADWQILN